MKTYRFNTVVETDGSVHLTGLPPHQEVEIVVRERTEPAEDLQEWLRDLRDRHPFSQMSKEEILTQLRRTRETVWTERHES